MASKFLTNTTFEMEEDEELTRSMIYAPFETYNPQQWQDSTSSVIPTGELEDYKDETLSFPAEPSMYRRDQTFRSILNKTPADVLNATSSVVEKYNKANGQNGGFAKNDEETPQEKLEWHNTGENKNNHLKGEFLLSFCDGIPWCQFTIQIYTTNKGYCLVQFSFYDGDKTPYYKIFDIISRDLMGNNGKETNVLEGLVCDDFYPLCPMSDMFFDFEDCDIEETCYTPEETSEIRGDIKNAMKRCTEARYYNDKVDSVEDSIRLLEAHRDIFVDCCIKDQNGNFLQKWCKSYRRESDIPLARCQLIFMEKLVNQASEELVHCMNGQVNGVFSTIFESWSNWREGGRYCSSWIMDDQIGRTILALRNKGFHATLRAGRRIPANYMKKQVEKYGPEYVRSFWFDLQEAIGQTFSKDFEQQLDIYDNPPSNIPSKECSNIPTPCAKESSNIDIPSFSNLHEICGLIRS